MMSRLQGAALEQAIGELAQGLVPTARAEIVFNRDDLNGAVRDVLVIDRDARLAKGIRFDQLGRERDLGASFADWSDRPVPEAVWGRLMQKGFASPAETVRALVQFARIRDCPWARRAVFEDLHESGDEAADAAQRVAIDSGEGLDFAGAERRLLALAAGCEP
jgi:hypothetical protein